MSKIHIAMTADNQLASHGYMEYRYRDTKEDLLTILYEVKPGMPGKLHVKDMLVKQPLPASVRSDEYPEFHARCILALANFYNVDPDNVVIEGHPDSYIANAWEQRGECAVQFADRLEFWSNSTMALNPNLVPFQDEWLDNIGSMANAIFWLDANWVSPLNAQGDRVRADGTREMWVYSRATGLLIHHAGGGVVYEIDRTKVVKIVNGNRDGATIYRPFLRDICEGINGIPSVEWLKTREVVVVKSHHRDRIPPYLRHAVQQLSQLLTNVSPHQFPGICLGAALKGPETAADGMVLLTKTQADRYKELYDQIMMITNTNSAYLPHHIHSYRALAVQIAKFNLTVDPNDLTGLHALRGMVNETQRLLAAGMTEAAAMVQAMATDSSYEKALHYIRHERDSRSNVDPTTMYRASIDKDLLTLVRHTCSKENNND